LAGQAQSRGEIARVVHARVVDQPLPPDSRAGLLEINAHEDAEGIPQLGAQSGEPAGVIEGTFRIVDRTRTDDGEEAGVASVQDGLRFRTPLGHGGERGSADRQLLFDHFRRDEALQAAHARVFEGASGLLGWHTAVECEPVIKPEKTTRCNSRLVQRLCVRSGRE
jgi:hypothetical protein